MADKKFSPREDLEDIFRIVAARGTKQNGFTGTSYSYEGVDLLQGTSFRTMNADEGEVIQTWSHKTGPGKMEYAHGMTDARLHKLAERLRQIP